MKPITEYLISLNDNVWSLVQTFIRQAADKEAVVAQFEAIEERGDFSYDLFFTDAAVTFNKEDADTECIMQYTTYVKKILTILGNNDVHVEHITDELWAITKTNHFDYNLKEFLKSEREQAQRLIEDLNTNLEEVSAFIDTVGDTVDILKEPRSDFLCENAAYEITPETLELISTIHEKWASIYKVLRMTYFPMTYFPDFRRW